MKENCIFSSSEDDQYWLAWVCIDQEKQIQTFYNQNQILSSAFLKCLCNLLSNIL